MTEVTCHEEFPKTIFCDPVTNRIVITNLAKKIFYSIVSKSYSIFVMYRNRLLTLKSIWLKYSLFLLGVGGSLQHDFFDLIIGQKLNLFSWN